MDGLDARRQRLIERFPEWQPSSLGDWLGTCAAEYGDRPLVITDERTLTYRETAEWAARLADGLVALGVRPGEHVGVLMANYPEFVPVKFAIALAGAVAIPMNFLYRTEELAYVLAQSQARVLITMTGFATLDYPGMLDTIAPGWENGVTERLPLLRTVIQVPANGNARTGVRTLSDLEALGLANVGAVQGISVDPAEVGDILYTSGTTGSPKGVLITHDAVLRTGYASALTRAFGDGRRILFSLPCYHMFGYVEGLIAAMMVGGAVIMQAAFDPVQYLAGIEAHRADDILCVPTMTVAILEHPDRHTYDLSSLSAVLSGAAPAPVWLWERVRDELGATEIVTGYGMTECGGAMTLTRPEDSFELTATTVGKPKSAGAAGLSDGLLVWYRTVDPATGEVLPEGAEGELVSHGPTSMLGFWDKPEETTRGLRDGWVYSGDLGRVRPDGYLEITGRSKELYKSGGELVMPKEIEELLTAHPEISQAYAVGIPDDRWGEAGCACVVRAPDSLIDTDAVIALCKARLARFKVPKHVVFLEASELPTTPTGKVQKYKLVAQLKQRLEQL
ncbi:AMP-binding protein [Nocardia sp. NPDC006630]|uniref:AMP-binding protein n=1 Tax=Nocardia sp. NPDC006630 TaxID=3157181 RepID=UPI0033AB7288